MEIKTLQEYLLTTEIHSYLVAVASVIAFGLFWRYLNKKPSNNNDQRSTDKYRQKYSQE